MEAKPAGTVRAFERADLEQSIAQRFEQIVAIAPDRTAIRYDTVPVSYRALNQHANRIAAHLLRTRGPCSEPVAVVLPQGPVLLAGILGVLKAGKFYVPLEALQPPERFAFLLRDCTATVALVSEHTAPLLRTIDAQALDWIDVDRIAAEAAGVEENPCLDLAPEAPAYIYYTTGSTGAPKGVIDSHRNVLHNIMRYTNGLGIRASDRLTLLQGPSFSGAVSSMFAALLNGAVSLPFDLRRNSASALADWIDAEQVTIYHSVPSIFRSWLQQERVFPSVRIIRLEGDGATDLDVRLYRRHFSDGCVLVNGLGATETGIVRRFFLDRRTIVAPGPLPIGHAVDDMEIELVDEAGAPVAEGAVGEIVVKSRYLALGYWNRPEQTRAAFSTDANDPTRRTYRTGDLGRFDPGGCLAHLGRRDGRVKIRGETVDVAMVEAALLSLPSIKEAVVLARAEAEGAPRLVAYYVPALASVPPTVSAIRRYLARFATPAMIPSAFVPLECMPLNDNAKVDRAAMPAPPRTRPRLDQPYVAPRDPTQSQLVSIWESLLGCSPVGVRDDFFDLGGDSLSAAQMVSTVAARFGIEVPIGIVLTAATVETLAAVLATEALPSAIVRLKGGTGSAGFYFLHGDYLGGGLFCRAIASHLDDARPFFAVAPCGLDGAPAPHSVAEMAERHLTALREVQPHGPYFLGGNCNGGLVALEMAARLSAAGERVERLVVFRSSARNARFSALRAVVERATRSIGAHPSIARAAVRHLRWFHEAWAERSFGSRWRLVGEKLVKLPGWLAQRVGSDRSARPAAADCGAAPRAQPEDLADLYTRALAEYVPPRYAGPVSLLWPEREAESPAEALAWWRKIAPSVRLDIVPGDHLSALTIHADRFAATLRGHLAKD